MEGKLIVIDGADGSGKATQTKLLVERLEKEGYQTATLDFPQYTQNAFGTLIRECLDGKRGDFMATDPRVASTLYAADRFESKSIIMNWLTEGRVVILDRYVSSNMLHQGAKIDDEYELKEFLDWLDHIEHDIFAVPRPNIIVYLEVPIEERARLVSESVAKQKHGSSVGVDVAEADLAHQKATEANAKRVVKAHNNWQTIVCTKDSQLRDREDIHDEVFAVVEPLLS